jgi:hypothetical protein
MSGFFKRSRKGEARLAEICEEQEQQCYDKLESDRLLKALDSLAQGGTR